MNWSTTAKHCLGEQNCPNEARHLPVSQVASIAVTSQQTSPQCDQVDRPAVRSEKALVSARSLPLSISGPTLGGLCEEGRGKRAGARGMGKIAE